MKICLNMIVKNEASVILRCLDALKDIIDAVIVSDTGSEDNTVEIIRDWIKDNHKIGTVVEHGWENFAHNRNLALQSCREFIQDKKGIWYALVMDADDYLVIEDKKIFLEQIRKPDKDKYLIDMKCESVTYARSFLYKLTDINWKWKYVLHESCQPDRRITTAKLKYAYIQVSREGNRSSDPLKYLRDILTLEQGLLQEPDNSRYMFYLAQSYRDFKDYKKAEKLYLKRFNYKQYDEERYISILEAAKCRMLRGKSDHKMERYLQQAFNFRPSRLEAPYYLIQYYRLNNLFMVGYCIGKSLLETPYPEDILFVDHEIHTWKFKDELAICACWVGDIKLFETLYKQILKLDISEKDKIRMESDLNRFGTHKSTR